MNPSAFCGSIDEWTARLHPLDRAAAVARVRAVIAGGTHYESEFRIVRADEQARAVEAGPARPTHARR
ncbi:MAG: PAS domain-containing protein [Mycobacterium sp.]|nr:PAS domain-containing protein [Mycobacterium sp.]